MTIVARAQVFRQNLNVRLAVSLVFLFAIGIVMMIAFEGKQVNTIAALCAAVLAGVWIALVVISGKIQITTNPLGIRRETAFGVTEIPWDRISEYRYLILSGNAGVHGGLIGAAVVAAVEKNRGRALSFQLTLHGPEKQKIVINSTYRNADQLRDLVLERLHPAMLAAARAQLEKQQPVTFGPLQLRPDAVTFKQKEPVPLGEVTKIDLSSARLRIKREGKMLDAISVRSNEVPNVIAFIQLAKEATEKRTMRAMDAGSVIVR